MGKIRRMFPFLIVNLFAFYVLPFFIRDTGSAMFFMLVVIPTICFIASLIYGIKNTFDLFYTFIIMLFFVPTIFIHYNESALVYVFIYGLISLIGNILGRLIFKISK